MSEQEKKSIATLAKAFFVLPDGKKEFLLGYAEGVVAMAERQAVQMADTCRASPSEGRS